MSKEKIYINGVPVWATNTGDSTQYIMFEDRGNAPAINVSNSVGIKEQYEIVIKAIVEDVLGFKGEIQVRFPQNEE